ncbi:MAG: fibrobacter succinogenes major paralogous domain-containing protein [Fibromonadales bacterium]|nr:fibrobacter succinogenes major paralogous domain-containing protein [Fibromonadales bacterium]
MKKLLFISLLLALVLAGCGQQQKAVVNTESTVKSSSSSSDAHIVAKASSSSKKAVESKPEEVKSLTDIRDGKQYKIVAIGNQIWMAENLNYNVIGSKCYDNKSTNCDKYGRLYNWSAATKSGCPKGWHLPSNAEWDVLYRYVEGTNSTDSPYESNVAGKYIKTRSGWNQNGNGDDKFGFSAMPGGFGNPDGYFNFIGSNGVWWSNSEYEGYYAYNRHLTYIDDGAHWSYNDKGNLFSIRCLRD